MEAVYSWKLGNIFGKKQFTDINGNVRTNVIKSVELIFEGVMGEMTEKQSKIVMFSLVDLSNFEEIENITNQMILDWALSKLHPLEKMDMENLVKAHFNDYESNQIRIKLNE